MKRLAALLALVLALGGCWPRQFEDGVDAARLVWELLRGGGTPIAREREATRDRYRPPGTPRGAILLMPGLHTSGRDEPHLTKMATALARRGFLVVVPDLVNFRTLRALPEDVATVRAEALRLASEAGPGRGVGMAAISYAAGPALLAALDPELGARLDFVFALGAYYDLEAVIGHFTAGPNELRGKWYFALANSHRLPPADGERLVAAARRRLADAGAPIHDLAAGLGTEGRSVLALLDNRDPRQTAERIAALPDALKSDLAALTLAGKDLSRLRPRLILVHGRDDPIVPTEESVKLAAAVPLGQARLELIQSLVHVEPGPGAPLDLWRLWRAARLLLAQRQDG
ncbi:MAG: alpha/beta hydrolase [Alphaproteobacteria bacterium]|nr:alpha/beta hydrolase [Alphaproteobacteria bacterium]